MQAALQLGWKTIDVVRSELGPVELSAFAIADNRTAELAEWDQDGLALQLASLSDEGFSYEEIGFFPPAEEDEFIPDVSDIDVDGKMKPDQLKITVECSDLDELDDLFAELSDRGLKVKRG
jgi:hypothetical protein